MADSEQMLAEEGRVRMWAAAKKISMETMEVVMSLGFSSMEALSCLEMDDLRKTKLPIGQQKLLVKSLASTFQSEPATTAVPQRAGEHQEGVQAEEPDQQHTEEQEANPPTNRTASADNEFVQQLLQQFESHQTTRRGTAETMQADNVTGTHGGEPLAVLDSRVRNLRCSVFAQSTKKTYSTYLSTYLQFCTLFNIPVFPISHTDLGRYVAYLSFKLKYRSIKNYLTVVRLLHLEAGHPNPLDCHFINSIIKGARRLLGDTVCQKAPITLQILLDIFGQLNFKCTKDLAFWAACVVAFFSFFRKSNLLVPSLLAFDPAKHLSRHNVWFTIQGAILKVLWSKTIQYRERALIIPLPFIPNSPLCPSTALWLAIKTVPCQSLQAPVFQYKTGAGTIPLTHSVFVSHLKCCLQACGVDPDKYTGHSFRRGGASFALECGVPVDLIQTQGDWRSDAYKNYIDPSLGARQRVASLLGQAVGRVKFS